jgi:hypothetical protein
MKYLTIMTILITIIYCEQKFRCEINHNSPVRIKKLKSEININIVIDDPKERKNCLFRLRTATIDLCFPNLKRKFIVFLYQSKKYPLNMEYLVERPKTRMEKLNDLFSKHSSKEATVKEVMFDLKNIIVPKGVDLQKLLKSRLSAMMRRINKPEIVFSNLTGSLEER